MKDNSGQSSPNLQFHHNGLVLQTSVFFKNSMTMEGKPQP